MSKAIKVFKTTALALVILICCGVIGLCSVFAVTQSSRDARIALIEYGDTDLSAKNVILMIGDGMGVNHLATAKTDRGVDSLYMESLALRQGQAETFSFSDNVTDSAAAGTALSCGVKVTNGRIAYSMGANITNMTEFAASLNKATGVIATETPTGATPASFTAHAKDRGLTDEIANCQITGNVDVIMGAGKEYFDGKKDLMSANGVAYYNSLDAVRNESGEGRYIACFDQIDTGTGTDAAPTLAELSLAAIDSLEKRSDENGFFLMIEASHIDKESHSNDFDGMVDQLMAFDRAVKAVVEWAAADGDTVVMVTADHETGKLQNDPNPDDDSFKSGQHTANNVYYFMYCKQDETLPDVIDNTQICMFLRNVMENNAALTGALPQAA